MLNIGPKSREWLAAVGVHSVAELRERGAVSVYHLLKSSGFNVSKNLLWALLGAEWGFHWTQVPTEIKMTALADLVRLESLGASE